MQKVLMAVYMVVIGLSLAAMVAGAFGAFSGSAADRAYVRLVGRAASVDAIE